MSISRSDTARSDTALSDSARFEAAASEIAALCDEAVTQERLDDLSDAALGQAFAALVRLYAAKAQTGAKLQPFARNSTATATDVAITTMAMLDATSMELFELGLWETMTNIRPARAATLADHQGGQPA